MGSPTKGTIRDVSFVELLKEAADSKLTGMIRVEKGPIIKVVYIQFGTVAFASSNEKSDRLTEVLKRAGKLTAEQIDDAQARLKPNVSLGKTLVELGYISPKDLLWGARAQVEGILHQLLFWKEGNYQILEGPLPKEIVSLGLPIQHVLYEGVQRTQDRDWVLQQIISPQTVYQLAPDFQENYSLMKLPADSVVSRINGKRPLEDIAQNAGLDTFEVCKSVAALQLLGLVKKVQDQPLQATLPRIEQPVPVQETSDSEDAASTLGQVLQMPTVAELEEEPAEEEVKPTVVIRPPVTEPEPEPFEDHAPVEETAPPTHFEEHEEIEEPASYAETPLRPERISHPTFGAVRGHRPPVGPRRKINWRKLALWMALAAGLALGGLKLYFYTQRAALREEVEKLTAPIKTPPPRKPATEQPPQSTVTQPTEPSGQSPTAQEQTPPPAAQQPVSQAPKQTPPAAKQPAPVTQSPPTKQPAPISQPPSTPSKPATASKQPPPSQKTPVTAAPAQKPVEVPPVKQAPAQKRPEPAPAKAETPFQLLQTGKLAEAAALWRKELAHAGSKYTIQLEIACQPGTVQEAVGLVDTTNLLVIPITYHGQSCYRILYGTYSSQSSAEAARSGLPSIFLKQEAPARVVPVSKLLQ